MSSFFTRKRMVVAAGLAAVVVVCVIFWVGVRVASEKREGERSGIRTAVSEAMSDPVQYAKDRVSGGIGAAISAGPNGFPLVAAVLRGSPAEDAGLKEGDIIVEIDGKPTQGKTGMQIVSEIKGASIGRVVLLVKRGETKQECVISRASWSSLKKLPVQ